MQARVKLMDLGEIEDLLKRAFNVLDNESTGFIDIRSLSEFMKWLESNSTEAEIQDIVIMADKNGDNLLDFEEFVQKVKQEAETTVTDEELKRCFSIFDQNKDGVLDIKDLRYTFRQLNSKYTTKIIEQIFTPKSDKDSQTLTFPQFKDIFNGKNT